MTARLLSWPLAAALGAAVLGLSAPAAGALSCDVLFELSGGMVAIGGRIEAEKGAVVRYEMTTEIKGAGGRSISRQSGRVTVSAAGSAPLSRVMTNTRAGAVATVTIRLSDGRGSSRCRGERALTAL